MYKSISDWSNWNIVFEYSNRTDGADYDCPVIQIRYIPEEGYGFFWNLLNSAEEFVDSSVYSTDKNKRYFNTLEQVREDAAARYGRYCRAMRLVNYGY